MESLITELVQAFDIGRGLAIVLMVLLFGAGSSLIILAMLTVRVRMHASHFDVIDRNMDDANKLSLEAIRQSNEAGNKASYAQGLIDGKSR